MQAWMRAPSYHFTRLVFFFQAEDGIRDWSVTGVQTCALPICWVRDGVEPPPSAYPRIVDGTLVTVAAHAKAFPGIPNFRLPDGNLRPPRLDQIGRASCRERV